jgi:cysteinyl-tRNA synthetase
VTTRIYDTRTAALTSIEPGAPVTIYVCGITPYDVGHLGHALVAVTFDTLRRYLEYRGHRVTHVQNVTDVDDDIIRKAAEVGRPTTEVVEENVAIYDREMRALNVRPPTYYPYATREIPYMLAMIQRLVADGTAYVVDGHVFFRAGAFPRFGELSRRRGEELVSDTEPERLHALKGDRCDFTLWQRSLPGEPSWPSVWGEGRPGWHIECSAMALRYLGERVTVHGGGSDLIFPHHECEIAQSEAFLGKGPVVQAWAHVSMLRIGGEKMSKSLKNMIFVSDLLGRYTSDGIRLYLQQTHYRTTLDYDEQMLAAADALARRLARAAALTGGHEGPALEPRPYVERFAAALDNDLDTPAAIAVLTEMAEACERAHADNRDCAPLQRALRELGGILGLHLGEG